MTYLSHLKTAERHGWEVCESVFFGNSFRDRLVPFLVFLHADRNAYVVFLTIYQKTTVELAGRS